MPISLTSSQILETAQSVLQQEAQALNHLASNLNDAFCKATNLILQIKGRLVLTGIGKSGHIAKKIAATLASTGTPAFFAHSTELIHGDFGMLTEQDLVIAISQSGNTQEVVNILNPLKRKGLPLISITSNPNSVLGQFSDIILNLDIQKEVCPLDLAPTTSTTATLALGDALAITLMKARNFSVEDFAASHPGGSLGRKLIKVSELMRSQTDSIPCIQTHSTFEETLGEISAKQLGFTCVLQDEFLVGLITDGDLRRAQLKFLHTVYKKTAGEIMNPHPKTVSEQALVSEALKIMENYRISHLLITSEQKQPVGILDLKDLLKAGIY